MRFFYQGFVFFYWRFIQSWELIKIRLYGMLDNIFGGIKEVNWHVHKIPYQRVQSKDNYRIDKYIKYS